MLLVIQNDPEVPLGTYADYLHQFGVAFQTVCPYTGDTLPDLAGFRAVIALGGAMGVHDEAQHPFLVGVKQFIADTVAQELPFLGICLGGQLLAHVLGGTVTAGSPWGEKGTLPVLLTDAGRCDPFFAGIDHQFITFQWHGDSFAIPAGAERLASSPGCPNQAFRFGANAYGTQFHPEVNRQIVANWSSWTPETSACTAEFLADFDAAAPAYNAASRRLLQNFLRIAALIR